MTTEAPIEQYLIDRVGDLGGVTRKVTYQGRRGAPDRHCYLPGGVLLIVECKRPEGGLLSALQVRELSTLSKLGFSATVVSSKEEIDALLETIKA